MRRFSFLLPAFLAACAAAPTSSPETTAADTAPGISSFGACEPGYQSECALLDVPLNHDVPQGEKIQLHIARKRGTTSAKQLWLLSGGPGQAGDIWNASVSALAAVLPETDIYVVDHRGTGYSHRLTCSQQDTPNSGGGFYLPPAEAGACLQELHASGDYDRLPYFTTRQAAEDLVDAIAATRTPGQKVYVWGGSYGTHWAHRFLQVAPNLADGIVFDGYLTPGKFGFVDFDKGAEEAGERFAAGCAADATCAAHMGPDPEARVTQILAGLDTNPCMGIDRDAARAWATSFLDMWAPRAFVFPFLHRLERCAPEDITAVNALIRNWSNTLQPAAVNPTYTSSGIVLLNIALSELWSPAGGPADLTNAQINANAEAQTWLNGTSLPGSIADLRAVWPLPADDASSLPVPVPSTTTKLLWLSGTLDMHTPQNQASEVASLYPNATIISLPGAAHTPSGASPMLPTYAQNCGATIAESFIAHDGVADTSCEAQMAATWYEAPNGAWSNYWWGTTDDWGDGAPTSGAAMMSIDPKAGMSRPAHSSAFAP